MNDTVIILEHNGMTPLHIAVGEGNLKQTQKLLENGANVNTLSSAGSCALHIAAAYGRCDLVRLLLEHGADPNIKDEDGMTAFDNAVESSCEKCQQLLLACSKRALFPVNSVNVNFHKVSDSSSRHACSVVYDDENMLTSECIDNSIASLNLNEQHVTTVSAVDEDDSTFNYCKITSEATTNDKNMDNIMALTTSIKESRPPNDTDKAKYTNYDKSCSLWDVNYITEWIHAGSNSNKTKEMDNDLSVENTTVDTDGEEKNKTYPNQDISGNSSSSTTLIYFDDFAQSQADTAFIRNTKHRMLVTEAMKKHLNLNTIVEVSSRFEKDTMMQDSSLELKEKNDISCTQPILSSTPNVSFISVASSIRSTITCSSCGSVPVVHLSKYAASEGNENNENDDDDTISLIEAHILPTGCQCHAKCENKLQIDHTDNRATLAPNGRTQSTLLEINRSRQSNKNIEELSNAELHQQLLLLGDKPGPITLTTRRVYELRLRRLLDGSKLTQTIVSHEKGDSPQFFNNPREGEILTSLDVSNISLLASLETELMEHFSCSNVVDVCKRGKSKTSFNYLLLDPRITKNLPARYRTIGTTEAFKIFLKAIFYIGKGTQSRPFAHFKEAIKSHLVQPSNQFQYGSKLWHIMDIWNDGYGVISLSVFHNAVPAEAFTREACMITALGKNLLTNVRNGTCYGPIAQWSNDKQRNLGTFLLRKAFYIFIQEGERQIFPDEL